MLTDGVYIPHAKVLRETEKALLIEIKVCWNYNKWVARSFWFPKSVVTLNGEAIEVATWFANKLCDKNTFHGYKMLLN